MKTQTKMKTETKLIKTVVKSAMEMEVESKRLFQMESRLSQLLDGAKGHDEIKKMLPTCEDFFKSLTSEDFVSLLNTTESKAIYVVLWYHYGNTMHKAVNKCAIATKERMASLYPLFRFYADESDTYI